ncbi:hypothetical protein [Streptomonospora litoralis]|uniref:DivIVA domain-containing protein n=1 Tax=Streptomonospora litoralis TaxID=2498135 RepID=A0A4P6PVL8_9ACTN|nr:hypothetical protein [Streptomonospora litoralis]QBI52123.1 hypothetical protein EKD16_01530 [Streptomonospora litoralis]
MTDSSPTPEASRDAADAPLEFDVVLRGYDRSQVETLLEAVLRTIAEPASPHAVTLDEARSLASFDVVLRGYDRTQVHAACERLLERLAAARSTEGAAPQRAEQAEPEFAFDRVLRGYDSRDTAELVESGVAAIRALRSGSADAAAARTAAAELRRGRDALPKTLRGFDRGQVDAAVDALCTELEGGPPAAG